MSELIRNWLLGVTAASMLLALAEYLVPDGVNKKIVRLAGGLVLALAALTPIIQLDEAAIIDATKKFQIELRSGSEKLSVEKDFLFESIIEEKTEAYILDKAKELGMECQVSVFVAWDGEVPIPHSVNVRGVWTQQQKQVFSQLIEEELGISKSLQRFEETNE